MPPPHYRAKRDANESAIVRTLLEVGASVQMLNAKGVPDLLVGWRGQNYLFETKTPKGKLTPDQVEWHEHWGGTIYIVRSADDALEILGFLTWRD